MCQSISIKRFTQIHTARHYVSLYKSNLLPILSTALLIGIGITQASKLEESNYDTLNTVAGLPKSISYDEIIKFAKTNSLDKVRNYQLLVTVYKALNTLGPSYIREKLRRLIIIYGV